MSGLADRMAALSGHPSNHEATIADKGLMSHGMTQLEPTR